MEGKAKELAGVVQGALLTRALTPKLSPGASYGSISFFVCGSIFF